MTVRALGEIAVNESRTFDFSLYEDVIFINTGDVLGGYFLHSDRVSKVGLPGQAKKMIEKGDILFSEIRPGNKRFALVDFEPEGYVVSTKFMVIRLTAEDVDPSYFYRVLTSAPTLNEFQKIAESRSGTFPQITFDAISYYPFDIPTLSEQKAIAHILSTLDDKIELNRRMNATLEGMAQALFKSWFVDFNPVIDNALAAGNPIPEPLQARAEARKAHRALTPGPSHRGRGENKSPLPLGEGLCEGHHYKPLPEDIQKQFPDRFVFNDDMGWVPEGWRVLPFGAMIENTIGGDWGKEEPDEKHKKHVAIIRGTDIPAVKSGAIGSTPVRWVEEKKFKTRELLDGDIVIEVSGGSPKQPTGRAAYITVANLEMLGGNSVPASFCRKLSPKSKLLGIYAAQYLDHAYSIGKMWSYQNQSTGISNFQTKTFLESELVALPGSELIMERFFKIVRPMIDKCRSGENELIAKLRDTLLPKLLSGELRIPDAEKRVADAL